MKGKQTRWAVIREVIAKNKISSQEEFLQILADRGLILTQATLSRDLKQLKVAKVPDASGIYIYALPAGMTMNNVDADANRQDGSAPASGFLSVEFADNLAVIKTLPGYANSIAYLIDQSIKMEIMGTIAGDDTILLIPREGFSRSQIMNALSNYIPNLR
jgi:transcriptional regulator of arginine metabolism